MLYTGCRISEICTLRAEDIYPENGYGIFDFRTKGGARNKVVINRKLSEPFMKYFKVCGYPIYMDSPVFRRIKGKDIEKPLSEKQIAGIFYEYAAKAKLPAEMRPHSTRATFITHALEQKCLIEIVQRSVGHKRLRTTLMYDKRIFDYSQSASLVIQY